MPSEPTEIFSDFPFELIESSPGDSQFNTARDALDAGYDPSQIWSVAEGDEFYVYGPMHHFVNVLYWVVTHHRHDGNTYYFEQ